MNKKFSPILTIFPVVFFLIINTASFGQGQRLLTVSGDEFSIWEDLNHSPEVSNPSEKTNIWLIVGDPSTLNISEQKIQARLKENGYKVVLTDDQIGSKSQPDDIALIMVSKTVNSLHVGNHLKAATCGFMTWEDNLQMRQFMGYSDNDGSQGTAWHFKKEDWHVVPDAPFALRAGLSGNVQVYLSADEMTYSPNDTAVPSSAIVVAEFYADDLLKTYYVYEKGSTLGDGSNAAGRRVYFGLYDDTFKLLNSNGLKLFDAAVGWASGN